MPFDADADADSDSSLDDSAPETSDRAKQAHAPLKLSELEKVRRIDKYVIEKAVGKGGMGVVFKAVNPAIDKTVALKLLAGSWDTSEAFGRFKREAVALGKMNHPHVLAAYDFGTSEFGPYLVMEYVDGKSIKEIVQKNGLLTVADAARVVYETALGLQHIHEKNFVHRDLKPSNLMLAASGQIKILDLGLALQNHSDESDEEADDSLTYSGQIMGTRDFMAPEQWLNTHAVDYRADIYGLACTIYFLLAGRAPYAGAGQSSAQIMNSHLTASFPSLAAVRPDVPQSLDRMLQRMGHKDPNQRLVDLRLIIDFFGKAASGADLAALYRCERPALAAGAGPPQAGASGKTVSSTVYTPAPRRRMILGIAAAATLLAIIAVSAFANRFRGDETPRGFLSPVGVPEITTANEPEAIRSIALAGEKRIIGKHQQRVNGTAFAPGDLLLASCGEDRRLRFFDLAKSNVVPWEGEHPEAVTDTAFAGGTEVVTVSADGKLRLWQREGDQLKQRFALPEQTSGGMTSLDVSPDGRWAATGGWDKRVRLWDLRARAEFASVEAEDMILDVAVTNDGGRVYFAGRDKSISIWQVDGKAPMRRLAGHEDAVTAIDLSSDESFLVSAGYDDRVRVWELASGVEAFAVDSVKPKAVRFFYEGMLFAVGDREGKIAIWNRETKTRLMTLTDTGPIDALSVTARGDGLLTGTDTGTVTYWPLRLNAQEAESISP